MTAKERIMKRIIENGILMNDFESDNVDANEELDYMDFIYNQACLSLVAFREVRPYIYDLLAYLQLSLLEIATVYPHFTTKGIESL